MLTVTTRVGDGSEHWLYDTHATGSSCSMSNSLERSPHSSCLPKKKKNKAKNQKKNHEKLHATSFDHCGCTFVFIRTRQRLAPRLLLRQRLCLRSSATCAAQRLSWFSFYFWLFLSFVFLTFCTAFAAAWSFLLEAFAHYWLDRYCRSTLQSTIQKLIRLAIVGNHFDTLSERGLWTSSASKLHLQLFSVFISLFMYLQVGFMSNTFAISLWNLMWNLTKYPMYKKTYTLYHT